MASKPGVVQDFVRNSSFSKQFSGEQAGSSSFDSTWKSLASNPQFQQEEHNYIAKTHFQPAANYAAKEGLPVSDPRVQEAVWSLSVQHGNYAKVISMAKQQLNGNTDPNAVINALYDARSQYVRSLGNLSASEKISNINRYQKERYTVLNMGNGGQ